MNENCPGEICICGYCVRCGHCGLKRVMFGPYIDYEKHIQNCPKRPKLKWWRRIFEIDWSMTEEEARTEAAAILYELGAVESGRFMDEWRRRRASSLEGK